MLFVRRFLTIAATAGVLALGGDLHAGLLWHVETADGRVVASRGADTPFNPASVLKIGTSWMALERLGPDHRFVTTFSAAGRLDPGSGTLHGALVVTGGADPDFQVENAILAARALNRLGLRRVDGGLAVTGRFWMGWEGGVTRRSRDPAARRALAGRRLLDALDPGRWNAEARRAWRGLCARRGWDPAAPPRVAVRGGLRGAPPGRTVPLVVHRSNPLAVILKRFDVFSNNDIERIADPLGGPGALRAFLDRVLDHPGNRLAVATASGEGENRLTPRLVVRLVRGFSRALTGMGLDLTAVLPVPGCDPGPVPRMFPALARGKLVRTVVCKTGTLATTDGGVAVLAGVFTNAAGRRIVFCVAAPRAGGNLRRWRRREERWLERLIENQGGARHVPCGAPFVLSDAFAEVEAAGARGWRWR